MGTEVSLRLQWLSMGGDMGGVIGRDIVGDMGYIIGCDMGGGDNGKDRYEGKGGDVNF